MISVELKVLGEQKFLEHENDGAIVGCCGLGSYIGFGLSGKF